MAAEMGVSESTVRRIWHAHGLKPHLVEGFSKDKHFAEKLEDIVGLYLNPPEHAIVMCVDEKSQIVRRDKPAWRMKVPYEKGVAIHQQHNRKGHLRGEQRAAQAEARWVAAQRREQAKPQCGRGCHADGEGQQATIKTQAHKQWVVRRPQERNEAAAQNLRHHDAQHRGEPR